MSEEFEFDRFKLSHGLYELFDSLSEEDLDSIYLMMYEIAYSSSPETTFNYYAGTLDVYMSKRFNRCAICKVEHGVDDRAQYDALQDVKQKALADMMKQYIAGTKEDISQTPQYGGVSANTPNIGTYL